MYAPTDPSESPPAHPVYWMQMLSSGAPPETMHPIYPRCLWKNIRKYLILIPGHEIELTDDAPPDLANILASRIVQDLFTDKLRHEEGAHVIYDNGVDSLILDALCHLVSVRFGNSVGAALNSGARFPAGYEDALRLSCAASSECTTTLFRWSPVHTRATAPFEITELNSAVASAVLHHRGGEEFSEFLANDFTMLPRPEPLWQFYSHRKHSICSRAQRKAVWALLLIGIRLSSGAGKRLPALPNEIFLYCILPFMRIEDLGSFFEERAEEFWV